MNMKKALKKDSLSRAAAKDALIWGTLYTTAFSGAASLLAPVMGAGPVGFSEVIMPSLAIFPSAGAAHGALMWNLKKYRARK